MEQNKVRTYFFYAVGEIALVMIGILLALQVNNWNEVRKERSVEQRILVTLKEDISNAILDLESQILSDSVKVRTIQTLLIGGPEKEALLSHPKIDSIMFYPLWSGASEAPVIQSYNDLKTSGDISVIKNRSIREELAEIETGFINLNSQLKDFITVQQIRGDEIALKKVNFIRVLKKYRYTELTVGTENNYRELINDIEIQNVFGAKMIQLDSIVNYRRLLLANCNKVIELIDSQIIS